MEVKLRSKTSHWPKILHRYEFMVILVPEDVDNFDKLSENLGKAHDNKSHNN